MQTIKEIITLALLFAAAYMWLVIAAAMEGGMK